MRSLSAEAFGRAKDYLLTIGRPLEQAQFKYLFEDGSLDEVAVALAAYQNPDGGYGHALEPDAFTPTSGALATSIGLRVLRETGATADHEQVRGAVGYLLATLDPEEKVWRIIPADANDYPHAPGRRAPPQAGGRARRPDPRGAPASVGHGSAPAFVCAPR